MPDPATTTPPTRDHQEGNGGGEAAVAVVDLLERAGHTVADGWFHKIEERLEDLLWAEGTNVGLLVRDLLN